MPRRLPRLAPQLQNRASGWKVADTALVVSGPIIVEHQMELTAQRDGVLDKIFFDAPARVKAGTMLAQLDDRQIAANLEAARAKSRSIAARSEELGGGGGSIDKRIMCARKGSGIWG